MREAMTSPSAKQSTRLIEKNRRIFVEVHAAVLSAIFAGRVITAFGVGHVGQALRQIAVRLLAWEGKGPVDRFACGHS